MFCVGTTSLRTIESLYWLGIKISQQQNISVRVSISQWDPYELSQQLSIEESLLSLLGWMKKNDTEKIITKTQIIIAPGYNVKIADGLITNFHQPQSTLLLLVAALIGEDWKKVYQYALENNFRFLSYGDGSLIFI
ncbi:MAG: S-adenosylmethionine:tRNA ribosyltransferase-isomerase [Bacteroidota bacterium]